MGAGLSCPYQLINARCCPCTAAGLAEAARHSVSRVATQRATGPGGGSAPVAPFGRSHEDCGQRWWRDCVRPESEIVSDLDGIGGVCRL